MIEFIQDDDRLRDERKKAKKNKDKYVGMSSESMGFRGGFDSSWQDKWPSSGISIKVRKFVENNFHSSILVYTTFPVLHRL